MSDRRTLYIIDAHAQIFRAYFAIRGGMNSPVTGEPTHAVFGFAGMLLKLLNTFKPQYVVMATDMPGKTFRDELYPEYKANRDAPPDDFHPQVQRIWDMTRMFGIPLIGVEGAEADDVIATLARQVVADDDMAEVDVRIVSRDKDLQQLLSERVTMFDIHKDETIDVAWLEENRGIGPEQVVDMLALMGDSVDNIPGVDGVGPKTAAKLIQEYGAIDGIYANIDKIKGKRKERLEEAREQMPLSRQLVKLKDDLDLQFNLEDARVSTIDIAALQRLFDELGFNRHMHDLEKLRDTMDDHVVESPVAPAPNVDDDNAFAASLFDAPSQSSNPAAATAGLTTAKDFDYEAVTTADQLDELVDTLTQQKLIAVDTETVGLGEDAAMCGICIAWREGHGVYIPVRSPDPGAHLTADQVLDALRPVLENEAVGKCGHNLKYDLLVLRHAGVNVRGVVHDSMIAAFLLGEPSQALDNLAHGRLKHSTIPISSLIGPGGKGKRQRTMDNVPLDDITPYAAEDADISLRLANVYMPMLAEQGMQRLADDVEMPLVAVLAQMQFNGIKLDPAVLADQKQQLADRIFELRQQILDATGMDFNLDSPKQLGEVLFNKLGFPVVKKTKTGASTDVEVMEKLAGMDDLPQQYAKVPELILEYRQYTKLVSTYFDNLRMCIHENTGRIHARFHQTGAATGRLSSSDPNLQNIPIRTDVGRQIRRAFVADDGHVLIAADYSQIELRLLAHLSEDQALIEAFRNDEDIHRAVAAQVFDVAPDDVTSEQRSQAKVINFGIIYGITAFGLSRRIDNLDVDAAGRLIADYRNRYKGIDRFLDACVHHATDHGYVATMMGRRRKIAQVTASNPQTKALGERLAINTVVQGSAADLIKLAMVQLQHRIDHEALPMKLLLQIHDELVVETPAANAENATTIVRDVMQNAMELAVPLKVDAGSGASWYDAKE